ncbi:hypothetical protein SAMN05877809_101358 [Rhodobacter sp. JA431]|uniref:DUF6778 family protein n=1 Tax=Rhodobacter sp. JA431 TaxID=570013 RepID=UPI000BCA1181|nr:DUF6778 family protein [Rhodobacter sp. JA431]SOB91458.1 hypothetical protein SAMN05877809_101358 [Rhodobacter sp. JA431]
MRVFPIAVVSALIALSACGAPEPASRAASDTLGLRPVAVATATVPIMTPRWNVQAVQVEVPRSLHVSEANLLFPIADIVWRGDARGDRYEQVDAIVTDAATRAISGMTNGQPVVVEITMKRFHALTERARYTVGGSYGVKMDIALRDANTGILIDGPRALSVGFKASGGQKAIEEEARGITEKVAITNYLTDYLREELLRPLPMPVGSDRISEAN